MQTITIGDETVKQETLVPLDEQDNPVTLYGGTVTIYDDGSVDVVSEWATIDLGNLNWALQSGTIGHFKANNFSGHKLTSRINALCSIYKSVNANSTSDNLVPDMCIKTNNVYRNIVAIADSRFNDAESFKAALSGIALFYEAETPITYHFSNLEELKVWLGENNFWCDISDDITVKYWNRGFGN